MKKKFDVNRVVKERKITETIVSLGEIEVDEAKKTITIDVKGEITLTDIQNVLDDIMSDPALKIKSMPILINGDSLTFDKWDLILNAVNKIK